MDSSSELDSEVKKREMMQDRQVAIKKAECEVMIKEYNLTKGGNVEGFCPPVFDGLLCWEETKAGAIVQQPCPNYFMGFQSQANAFKECLANGSWFKRNENPTWTNFTLCKSKVPTTLIIDYGKNKHDNFIVPYLPALKIIADTGYAVSLLSLLVAFTILISIKRLRCPRNVLHMHLFASFIMRAFTTLLKDWTYTQGLASPTYITDGGELLHHSMQVYWPCRLLTCIWQYSIMANYSLILMEGLYLHNLIFLALFTDSSSISLYVFLGWGLPVIFVVPWIICKTYLENEFCWTINSNRTIFLLIRGPTTTTIVVNFILFINIVRVLWRKLQSSVCEETKTYRRWAKSTLVLLPLFGVHYMIFLGLQYGTIPIVEIVWLFADQLFTSFNGFFVALLYCFLNGEVKNELHKKWSDFSFRELLERWHLYGHESIFSSSRFLGDRHRRQRESCYSNSCTVDTIVQSCNRDKKRQVPVMTLATPKNCEIKDGHSSIGKERRWSAADCDSSAVELKEMISPNNNIVQL